MDELINILLSPKCCICKTNKGILCKNCLDQCRSIQNRFCMICNKNSFNGKMHENCMEKIPYSINLELFAPFYYEGVVRKCIKLSKYKARIFSPLKLLTQKSLDHSQVFGVVYANYIVVPIPIHKKKYHERGYNQADVIAKSVAKFYKIAAKIDLLQRVVYTKSQYQNTRKERYDNLKGAFAVWEKYKNYITGKKFLLVDDLCTSGATFLEAAHVLYTAGAGEVKCFAIAKKF